MELIPFSGNAPENPQPLSPGTVQGIFITMSVEDETRLDFLSKVRRWFANRPEVALVDRGSTDKQSYFFIILEWHGYAIDPLFIAILEEEEAIEDYTVYGRSV